MDHNPFTQFSLGLYRRAGVESVLLELQERFAADVTMLLYACWLAKEGRRFDEAMIEILRLKCSSWRSECVLGLRKVRRYLKTLPDQLAVYEKVKQAEIQSELSQMEWMWQTFEQDCPPESNKIYADLARENLSIYCRLLPGVEWPEADTLINELLPLLD